MLHGPKNKPCRTQGYKQDHTMSYHLLTRLWEGSRSRQKMDISSVPLLRAQPQGVVDLGYARVRGGREVSVCYHSTAGERNKD